MTAGQLSSARTARDENQLGEIKLPAQMRSGEARVPGVIESNARAGRAANLIR